MVVGEIIVYATRNNSTINPATRAAKPKEED